jgi:alpha-galactosidase
LLGVGLHGFSRKPISFVHYGHMTRVVFVGAGSVVFTRQLVADLAGYRDLGAVELVMHDIDDERLAVAEGTARRVAESSRHRMIVTAEKDRRRALVGADFVVNMVQIGGIDATRKDLEIPARYGLLQTIGDTTGVGGVFRGLRTFPFLSELAADMMAVCPEATLLNYTNPMAMNVWWLSLVAPDLRVIGLCHSVFWTAHDLSEIVGAPFDRVTFRAAGVNHQAWMLEWTMDGEDLYPLLRERIRADNELQRRVRAEMFLRIGYYPTETSEHSSEYLSWFLRSRQQTERFRVEPLQYLGISERNVLEFRSAQRALASGTPTPVERGAAEYAPQVIHAMVTGEPIEIHGNVPNRGLIDNLPSDAVVEVPVKVDGQGFHPRAMGSLPLAAAAQNQAYVSVCRLAVSAALEGDPTLVRQAVLTDPNANSTLTPEQIWAMCNDLVVAHAELLPPPLRSLMPAAWS